MVGAPTPAPGIASEPAPPIASPEACSLRPPQALIAAAEIIAIAATLRARSTRKPRRSRATRKRQESPRDRPLRCNSRQSARPSRNSRGPRTGLARRPRRN
jgi:hypothetical protein